MNVFQDELIRMFDNLKFQMMSRPLTLGGVTSSGGGSGGPPGGFLGVLPQSRVAYDLSEIATTFTPASGQSLIDNLNHIRSRIQSLEGGIPGASNLIIEKDGTLVASGVTVIDFYNAQVTTPSTGHVHVVCSGGGGGSEGISYYAWDADAKPETPNILDDEFDDNSFSPVKWTSVDEDGANSYAEDERGLIITPDIAKGGKLAGIFQTMPGTDFTMWTKVLPIGIRDQGVKPVLCLAEDSDFTKKFLTMSWTVGGSDYIMQTEYWDDNDNLNTGYDNDSRQWTTSAGYMRMRIIGTKCSMDYSNDGVAWFKFRVIDPIPFTPTKIGLMVRTDSLDEDVKVIFRFFRVTTDTALAAKMEGHKVVRYRV
jgi:hypothetical protein